jgi:hypothetical protein
MKNIIKKITCSLIAFLVLFSTFSFSVDRQYCEGSLIAISYIGATEICKSAVKEDFSFTIKGCCSNEVETIKGQNELQIHGSKKLTTEKEQFIAIDFTFYRLLFIDKSSRAPKPRGLFPVNIPINHQVLHQCFLI